MLTALCVICIHAHEVWYSWLGLFLIAAPICMKETRVGVLLTRLAKKMRKETRIHHYRARIEDERASLRTLIYISCTRPICAPPSPLSLLRVAC